MNGLYTKHHNGAFRFPQIKHADLLKEFWVFCNKLQINITLSQFYGHQYEKLLLEYLPLLSRINVELYKRAKSELRNNVRNNVPIPPGPPHYTTIFIIYGINITDLVGEIIRKKTSHN